MSKTKMIVSRLKEEALTCRNPERLVEIAGLLRFWSEWGLAEQVENRAREIERQIAESVNGGNAARNVNK